MTTEESWSFKRTIDAGYIRATIYCVFGNGDTEVEKTG